MSEPPRLGELQHAILQVLWDRGEATVAEVHRSLHERGLAPTTIATMLTKMERKGVVEHRTEQRRFIYRATVEEPDVRNSMVQDVVDRVFAGDRGALVHHLLTDGEIAEGELEELRALIERREREGGHRGS